ncbi:hypothetical protein ACMFMG_000776 [Clarireedia jacksonii]
MNTLLWSTLMLPSAWAAARASVPVIEQNRTLLMPSSAQSGRRIIDAAFQSYSIELSSMIAFAGNLSLARRKSPTRQLDRTRLRNAIPPIRHRNRQLRTELPSQPFPFHTATSLPKPAPSKRHVRSITPTIHTLWNAESVLYDGITRTGVVKTIAVHDCQGAPQISNVFAAALWSIDYVFYVSTLHSSRLYFHQGTNYRYSAWQPITTNASIAEARPLYYGNLFVATALAGGGKQVAVLVNETAFTAYGIYGAGVGGNGTGSGIGSKLSGIAIVNLEMWNSTQSVEERPYTAVRLPIGEVGLGGNATVRRQTSPGVGIAGNITWVGRSVDSDGFLTGIESLEKAEDSNTVLVGAGEAILITL